MLRTLHIRNFAIIDDLEVTFYPGLNILTGETGAGKSIILDALGLLMGHKATASLIRADAAEASVEAVYELPAEASGTDTPTLQVRRVIRATGRSVCRINGKVATIGTLRHTMANLIETHGQGEHLHLMEASTHLQLLDRFGGLEGWCRALGQKVRRCRKIRQALNRAEDDSRALMQRLDMLRFQVAEIRDARIEPGEDERLQQEQKRLGNAELLRELATGIRLQLEEGDAEVPPVLDLLGASLTHLEQLAQIDAAQNVLAETLQVASDQIAETCRSLGDYAESLDTDPYRLHQVEDRMAALAQLKRKYGATLEEVLAFGRQAAAELESLDDQEGRTERLEAEQARLLAEIARDCGGLSTARREAGRRLEAQVSRHLEELFGGKVRFEVLQEQEEAPDGIQLPDGSCVAFDQTGMDSVTFLVSTNPGEPPRPLAHVASGGETARLMLALKSVLSTAKGTPTLILDEIDQGIGGRMGMVVGHKLWHLAHRTPGAAAVAANGLAQQILCVTHMPQVAVFGDVHFAVRKEITGQEAEQRTRTSIQPLAGDERLRELATMQGNLSASGLQAVTELMQQAQAAKQTGRSAAAQACPEPVHAGRAGGGAGSCPCA